MVEVGVIKAHPLKVMFLHALSVIRTWRHARRRGLPANEWYGVYERGTEKVIAHMGCMPTSRHYATILAVAENKFVPDGDLGVVLSEWYKLRGSLTKSNNLLHESRDLLHHTSCKDDDAMQCPACSLESRIDATLKT